MSVCVTFELVCYFTFLVPFSKTTKSFITINIFSLEFSISDNNFLPNWHLSDHANNVIEKNWVFFINFSAYSTNDSKE